MSQIVYVALQKNKKMHKRQIFMSDIADIHCENKKIEACVKALKVGSGHINESYYVVGIIEVIRQIENYFNETRQIVEVNSVGENKCLVELDCSGKKRSDRANHIMDIVKCFIVCFVLFFGAGFSIMAFNNDISIGELFNDISKYFGNDDPMIVKILAVSYALGLFIGITVFYNHFNKKKFSNDPTPVEVQMNLYEDDVIATLTDRIEGKQ